jgi:predicted DNA-binding transcriptional regulator AlpA
MNSITSDIPDTAVPGTENSNADVQLSARELSPIVGLAPRTIVRKAAKGKFPAGEMVNRVWKWKASVVQQWLTDQAAQLPTGGAK